MCQKIEILRDKTVNFSAVTFISNGVKLFCDDSLVLYVITQS